ncbi:MAG: TonB-dependent receptor plug domain-containing protein [Steroidobacteraceae bacterium]
MSGRIPAILAAWLAASTALAEPVAQTTLVEAIERARAEGAEIAYSTQLVQGGMTADTAAPGESALAALRRALEKNGLALAPGTGNRWLVVRAQAAVAPDQGAGSVPPESPVRLALVIVTASRHSLYDAGNQGEHFLSGDDIRRMPHMADDASRAFQRLPGVAASDYQAPFNLRGGTTDEVKVQLDGQEIADPYHMRVLFRPLSIIDAGIIDRAQVLTGGYTAEHGNAMSGVIDIDTGRPDGPPVHELGVSFVSAFLRTRGESADGRAAWRVSARRGYLDLLADQVTESGEELKPRYADLYAGFDYSLNDAVELQARALIGNDDVSFTDPADGEDFGEDSKLQYYWLAAEVTPTDGVIGRTAILRSSVDSREAGSQINPPFEQILRDYRHDYESTGVQTDWTFERDERRLFKLGARWRDLAGNYDFELDAVRRNDFVDGGLPYGVMRAITHAASGDDASAYAAWRQRVGERFITEVGLRWDRQNYADTGDDSQVSPRVNVLWRLNDRAALRFAWGEFWQPQAIEGLDAPDGDLTFYPAEQAEHRVVGLSWRFASGLQLKADAYDKRYRNPQPRYESLIDLYEFSPESNFDRVRIHADSGHAWGAELTLQSPRNGTLSWWANYSWAHAEDRFDGRDERRSWDQRQALTASVAWQGAKWSVSAIGRWHSGWPRTPIDVVPIVDAGGNVVGYDADLSRRNQDRYDEYSRIDVRFSRRVPLSRGSFQYYLEIFNVLDASNPCCTSGNVLTINPGVSVTPTIDDYLPRFPSFGFLWRFGPGAG